MTMVILRIFVGLIFCVQFVTLSAQVPVGLPCDLPVTPGTPAGFSVRTIPSIQRHTVRVAYLIPSNRTPQDNAVYKLQTTVLAYQAWYRDQMERNGFGSKTFRYETEADGLTPKIHVVNVNVTDAYLLQDLWGRTINAAGAAGVPVWSARQVWWLVPEAHLLNSDGSLTGGTALGASFGSGDDAGVGMIGSDGLVRMNPGYLPDNRNYAGMIIPELGPHRLVQDVTFPWFEGTSLSSVSSSIVGAGLHELSHAFGLPHNFRNDDNMHGNLMGNGLRGWRGAMYPDRYAADYVRLAYGNALFLNYSRYFNSGTNFTDNTKPSVTIQTPASVQTTNGAVHIQFRASDSGGLAAAWLIWKGDLVDELVLSGNVSTQKFQTPYFSTTEAAEYKVIVIDRQGNRGESGRNITVASGGNSAPQPKVKITPTFPSSVQNVTFNATGSSDPNHSPTVLQAEWDFENDGVFDTPFSPTRLATRTFAPGVYQVRARLRDPSGAITLSAPIGFRVVAPEGKQQRLDTQEFPGTLHLQWPITPFGFRLQTTSQLDPNSSWSNLGQAPIVWGISNVVQVPLGETSGFFRLIR